ncbi:PEP-CTERM sorting domain-containing protein, partial [bacterium]|nr:PEP-CTERM sorting domain-containing protein [bacterium]
EGGGTIAPGASVGTMTVELLDANGNFQMHNNSTYEWELGAHHTADLVAILGDLQVDAMTYLELLDGGVSDHNQPPIFPGDQFDIFTYTGTTNLPLGDVGSIIDFDASSINPGDFFHWDVTGAQIIHSPLEGRVFVTGLQAVMIPEPATVTLLGLSLLALARRRKHAA